MKVLVTGGTGYLGRAVVRALAARGHAPVVFARTARQSGLPGTPSDGDIRDRAALETAAAGCDAICHMAALVSIWRRRRQDFDDVNVGGLQNVLAAAAAAGIRRMVYTSSFLALPPRGRETPLEANDYQRTKVAADRVATASVQSGHPLIRIYPGVIYGPGSFTEGNLVGRLIADHLKGKLPAWWAPSSRGRTRSSRTSRRVIVRRSNGRRRRALCARRRKRAATARLRSAWDMTGRRPPRRIPFGAATALGAAEELRVNLFGGTPLITRGAVDIFRQDWSLDSAVAVRDLGYTMTPLVNGIHRTLESLTSGGIPPS